MYVKFVEHLSMYRDARVLVSPNRQIVACLAVIRDARVIRRTEAEFILFSRIPRKRQ